LISFRTKADPRRRVFLRLASQIERQLREAYDRRYHAKKATQSSIAKALDIDRSAIHRRLTGRTNMRLDTLADMVWALDCVIDVHIRDADHASARLIEDADVPRGDFETLIEEKSITESGPRGSDIYNGLTLLAA
jgi:hypothetical protein